DIGGKVQERTVILLQGIEGQDFASYRQFLVQLAALERIFKHAGDEADRLAQQVKALESDAALEFAPAVTTAGVVIDAATKLGSYFLSDYEIGGIALTPDTEQLVSAVAGKLLKVSVSVMLPARRVPQSGDFAATLGELIPRV